MNNKDTIKSLNVREQCRLKLPIWYGSRDNYLHGFREVLANASDEITNNYDDGFIDVVLSEDRKRMSVFDSGRGIPILGETDGVKNYELLFLRLFSGTNYDNLENGKVTTGTNGSGVTILNYTSTYFEVNSYKEYKKSTLIFKDGGELVVERPEQSSDIKNGTQIVFELDDEVYTNTVYNVEEVKTILNSLAGSNNKLTIHFRHQDMQETYHYDSLENYLTNNSINTITNAHTFNVKKYNDESELNMISCTWNVSTEPFQATYLNYTYLKDNGAIYDGFIDGMKKVFTKTCKSKFTNLDIEMSFGMVISLLSTNVEYANQTKFSTSKQLYKKLVSEYIVSNMEVYKAENPQEFDKILKHLQQINTFNMKNENSIKKIKKELSEKANNMLTRPKKLVPCRSKDPNNVSIKLLEGDSALNICKQARDPDTMMILPLKGKPINALKCTLNKLLENQEVIDMFKVFGCGLTYKGKSIKGFDKFNLDNLNVNMISLLCDRDEDGGHLETLALGILYTLSPKLIENGHVEVIQTPLYIITTKTEKLFAYSELERVDLISKLTTTYREVRYKGIGGLPVDVMHMALDEDTKRSIVITMKDAKKCADKLELFLSSDVDSRKKYIEENGDKYVSDDVYI